MHGTTLAVMLSAMAMSPAPLPRDPELLPSAPAAAVTQALAGDVRLVAWELANGTGIEAQLVDAATHEPLSERLTLGSVGTNNVVRIGSVQTRPVAAGLEVDDTAIFLVAWHAELLDTNGNSIGTDVVGRRLVFAQGSVSMDPIIRISGYDQDLDPTAASEARSAPVVIAHPQEEEFLVLWTHWPEGKPLHDSPPATSKPLNIHGMEIPANGDTGSSSIIRLDTLAAPLVDGQPMRRDRDPIFLAAAAHADKPGYLLAWSDPAQESGSEDLAQIHTKPLPENLHATRFDERIAHVDSISITEGTGRIALAPLPGDAGYLLAYEDMRGKAPLAGVLLDAEGQSNGISVRLLDGMQPGDHAFISPVLIRQGDQLLLLAAAGDRNIDGLPHESVLHDGRLALRRLDPARLDFNPAVEDFFTITAGYPSVNIYFADQSHAAGVTSESAVAFMTVPDQARIRIHDTRVAEVPDPGGPPSSPPTQETGGGAGGALWLLAWLAARRPRRWLLPLALMIEAPAFAEPPDVELLHRQSGDDDCYRVVMYRETTEIHLGTRWGDSPLPPKPATRIVSLPAGWKAETVVIGGYQYVALQPAGFDGVTGFALGEICLRFPPMETSATSLPYTYELTATGSRISAEARIDDGLSESELRALARRVKRVRNTGGVEAPRKIEETKRTVDQLKGLFD